MSAATASPNAPAANLTLTPRQRIVVRREMARQKDAGGPLLDALERSFPYDGAGYLRRRRTVRHHLPGQHRHRPAGQTAARGAQQRFGRGRGALTVDNFALVEGCCAWDCAQRTWPNASSEWALCGPSPRAMRKFIGPNMPVWDAGMPHATRGGVPATERASAQAVYFPSCVSRTMGRLPGEDSELSS